jgi:hypothetical protein
MAFSFWEKTTMPASPFEGEDVERPSGDRRQEQRQNAAVEPEMRAAPRDQDEDARAEETIDEPGYGHGV